jgi:uncharacterized damage-inducible protein DinB
VILIQVINHTTEHREQLKSILTTLGQPHRGLMDGDLVVRLDQSFHPVYK